MKEEIRIVYIAHPVGGNVKENLEKIRVIVRRLNLKRQDIVPFVPYWLDCHALNDNDPTERNRGIMNCEVLFGRGFIDEIWLYGNTISQGMKREIEIAKELGINVVAKTDETIDALIKLENYGKEKI